MKNSEVPQSKKFIHESLELEHYCREVQNSRGGGGKNFVVQI